MRALYTILGLVLGVYLASSIGSAALIYQDQMFDTQFHIAILTGYYEGLARGKEHANGEVFQAMQHYASELRHCQESK